MKHRSVLGFIIGSGIGMSVQPINMYLTKKKTGSDGFVGVEGRSKDDSVGFKILKPFDDYTKIDIIIIAILTTTIIIRFLLNLTLSFYFLLNFRFLNLFF